MNDFNIKNIINDLMKKMEDHLYIKKKNLFTILTCLIIIFGFAAMNRTDNKAVDPDERSTKTDTVQDDSSQTGIETLSLRNVALQTGIPLDQVTGRLQKKGFKLNTADDTIEQIAKDNRTSSERLLRLIESYQTESMSTKNRTIARLGGMTLEELCDQKNLSLNEILSRFEMLGLKVDPKDKMKEIAKNLNLSNAELIDIIEGRTG
jgi:hypothetical protein